AALASWLSQQTASAGVQPALVAGTVKASILAAAGHAVPVSAQALALSEGVVKTMFLSKLKILSILCVGMVLGGLAVGLPGPGGRRCGGGGGGGEPARRSAASRRAGRPGSRGRQVAPPSGRAERAAPQPQSDWPPADNLSRRRRRQRGQEKGDRGTEQAYRRAAPANRQDSAGRRRPARADLWDQHEYRRRSHQGVAESR